MVAKTASSTGPLGHEPRIDITEAIADWHRMICDPPPATGGPATKADACQFLDAKISADVGCGTLDLVTFDEDFMLLGMRGKFLRDLNYVIVGEGWTRLHFRRSARSSMDFEGIGQSEFEGPLCQILHQPEGVEDEEWIEGGVPLEWVTLFVRPELLVERFRLDSVRLIDPVRRLAQGADDFLLENRSLSPQMIRAMSELLRNPYSGDLRRVHLEAKCIEMICMMSGVLAHRPARDLPVKLSADEVERLHEARSSLSRTYASPPSIEALARRLALNRTKLTYGFKHLFDMTISEFCTECRLEAAWELLRDTDLPIGVVAHQVGYRQPASLSTAFKSRFGLSPRQVRSGERRKE